MLFFKTLRYFNPLTLCLTAGNCCPHHGRGYTRLGAMTIIAGKYASHRIVPSTCIWSFVCVSGSTKGGAPWRHSTFIKTAPGLVHVAGPIEESETGQEAGPRNIYSPWRFLYEGVGGIILWDPAQACGGGGGSRATQSRGRSRDNARAEAYRALDCTCIEPGSSGPGNAPTSRLWFSFAIYL